jgi:hypothetical protein
LNDALTAEQKASTLQGMLARQMVDLTLQEEVEKKKRALEQSSDIREEILSGTFKGHFMTPNLDQVVTWENRQRPSMRPSHEGLKLITKLPRFGGPKGETPWETFLQQVKIAALSGKIEEKDLKLLVLRHLEGTALQTVMQHPDIHTMTYGKLIELLAKRYGRTDAQAMVEIQQIKQRSEESVSDYATRMRVAAGPLMPERPPEVVVIQPLDGVQQLVQNPMHPEMMIAYASKMTYSSRMMSMYFLQGLQKHILHQMRPRVDATFEQCVDDALAAEAFLLHSNSITYSINAMRIEESPVEEKDVNRIQKSKGTGLEISGRFSGTGTFDGNCHFCKRRGHRARDCLRKNRYAEKSLMEMAKNKYRDRLKDKYRKFKNDDRKDRKRDDKKRSSKGKKSKRSSKDKGRKKRSKKVNNIQEDSDSSSSSSDTSSDSSLLTDSSSDSASSDNEDEQPKNE